MSRWKINFPGLYLGIYEIPLLPGPLLSILAASRIIDSFCEPYKLSHTSNFTLKIPRSHMLKNSFSVSHLEGDNIPWVPFRRNSVFFFVSNIWVGRVPFPSSLDDSGLWYNFKFLNGGCDRWHKQRTNIWIFRITKQNAVTLVSLIIRLKFLFICIWWIQMAEIHIDWFPGAWTVACLYWRERRGQQFCFKCCPKHLQTALHLICLRPFERCCRT